MKDFDLKSKAIVLLLVVLMAFTGCTKKKENNASSPENNAAIENSTSENKVEILEDEGEIEIEVPDDMESSGF